MTRTSAGPVTRTAPAVGPMGSETVTTMPTEGLAHCALSQ